MRWEQPILFDLAITVQKYSTGIFFIYGNKLVKYFSPESKSSTSVQNSLFGEASGASEDDRENSLKGSSGANLLEREEDEEARTNENRARLTGNPDLAGTPVKVLSLSLSLSLFLSLFLSGYSPRALCRWESEQKPRADNYPWNFSSCFSFEDSFILRYRISHYRYVALDSWYIFHN